MPSSSEASTVKKTKEEQAAEKIIADLRKKLLDFSRKNNLVNLNHSSRSRSHIRVIDELPDQLFKEFLTGSKFQFKSLPDPDENIQDEQTPEFQKALKTAFLEDQEYLTELRELGDDPSQRSILSLERKLRDRVRENIGLPPVDRQKATVSEKDMAHSIGLNPSYEMPLPGTTDLIDKKHSDHYLQTLLFPKQLESKVSKIYEQVRLTEQETGVNTLYCVFGFLEWYPDSNDKACVSPLLLCPLGIEREFKDGKTLYSLSWRDEEVTVNLTLLERLKAEFGIELPEFTDEDTPESYFLKTKDRLGSQPDWIIKRYVTIGLFSFARQMMYLDLDNENWPQDSSLTKNSLLSQIFSTSHMDRDTTQGILQCVETYNPDLPEVEKKVPVLIYDSDSSQFSAIKDVMEGKSIVVEGPPGTGKSQTITNLIANAIVAGKTVLFVAEKKTALDVVNKRLAEAGLGDFCLELHSNKTNKKLFYDSFKNRLGLKSYALSEAKYRAHRDELAALRDQLNRYVSLINTPYGAAEITIHNVFGKYQKLKSLEGQIPKDIEFIEIEGITKISQAELKIRQATLQSYEAVHNRILEQYESLDQHPWAFVQNDELTIVDKNKACHVIGLWLGSLRAISTTIERFTKQHNLPLENTLFACRDFVEGIKETVSYQGSFEALIPFFTNSERKDFERLIELRDRVETTKENIGTILDPELPIPSEENGQQALKIARESGLTNYTLPELFQYLENIKSEHTFWKELNRENLFSSATLLKELIPYLSEKDQKAQIEGLIELLNKKEDTLTTINGLVSFELDKLLSTELLNRLNALSSCLQEARVGEADLTLANLRASRWELEKYEQEISKLNQQVEKVLPTISPLSPANAETCIALLSVKELLEDTPRLALLGSIPGLWDESAFLEIQDQQQKAITLREHSQYFSDKFRLAFIDDYQQLKTASATLVAASSFGTSLAAIMPFINPELSKALKFYKRIDKEGKKLTPSQMADEMMQLFFFHTELQAFNNDEILKRQYGQLFKGIDTDFDEIQKVQAWGSTAKAKLLAYGEIGRGVLSHLYSGNKQQIEQIIEYLSPLPALSAVLDTGHSPILTSLLSQYNDPKTSDSAFSYFLNIFVRIKEELDKAIEIAAGSELPEGFNYKELKSLINSIQTLQELTLTIESLKNELLNNFELLLKAKIEHFKTIEEAIADLRAFDLPLLANIKLSTLEDLGLYLSEFKTAEPEYASKRQEWEQKLGSSAGSLDYLISPVAVEDRDKLDGYIAAVKEVWSKKPVNAKTENTNADLIASQANSTIESWLLSKEAKQKYELLQTLKAELESLLKNEESTFKAVAEFAKPNLPVLMERGAVQLDILTLKLQAVVDAEAEFNTWVEYLRLKADLSQYHCALLAEAFQKNPTNKIAGLADAYEYVFFNALCKEIFRKYPELQKFSGNTHEVIRKRFQELDKSLQDLDRRHAYNQLLSHKVSDGIKSSYASERTDKALIERETQKKIKHVPIRELMKRAGMACQQLKPCFMMSPLSVAQFVPPGLLTFDIVIMDEASQIKPEEAIGAVARGRQFVVVGDPQQLGPTNFFNRSLEIEEDEEEEEKHDIGQLESILDLSLDAFKHRRRLSWHYRSRHQSLIAYSNQAFYDSQLHVFPSAVDKHPDYGIQFIPVEQGVYRSGKGRGAGVNIPEAEMVVEHALAHMAEKPAQSLGVVAINKAQSELINEILEKEIALSQAAQAYMAKWENTIEDFFVKNLESVQGDERDVIFISTVYGKDAEGNFYQRYGPINNAQGHRRLNVLFTRAKNKTVIFSSMTPDMIRVGDNTLRGVRVLKDYLSFAQNGQLPQILHNQREPDSEFSVFVANRLKDSGYEVELEVGVSGFFIDIAVRHPKYPASFLLGVECDGFTYHSSKSARDRDRLRQTNLENLGWKIYRIWSTDWFKNPKQEMQRLLSYIERIQ